MDRNNLQKTRKPIVRKSRQLSQLFETDETAWLEEMSKLVKNRCFEQFDYLNLSEFLLDMAKRDKREVMSRLTTLLTHLLKWDYQPRKRSRSWEATIIVQKQDLEELLESQTLKNHSLEILPKAYAKAIRRASAETGLNKNRFPAQCPYSVDQLLSSD
jgi:hypothetical protein